jgi:hypothetical protein
MLQLQIVAFSISRLKSRWSSSVVERKNKVYSNNAHTLDELQHNICDTVTSVEVIELKLVPNNLFKRFEFCLRRDGRLLNIFYHGPFF